MQKQLVKLWLGPFIFSLMGVNKKFLPKRRGRLLFGGNVFFLGK